MPAPGLRAFAAGLASKKRVRRVQLAGHGPSGGALEPGEAAGALAAPAELTLPAIKWACRRATRAAKIPRSDLPSRRTA